MADNKQAFNDTLTKASTNHNNALADKDAQIADLTAKLTQAKSDLLASQQEVQALQEALAAAAQAQVISDAALHQLELFADSLAPAPQGEIGIPL